MKIVAVKTLDGRVLESFKRPIEWNRDAWLDTNFYEEVEEIREVILVGVNGDQKRVLYQRRSLPLPPYSFFQKMYKEQRKRRREAKVVLAFFSVYLMAWLGAGYSSGLAFAIALVVAVALHFSYEIKDLHERLEEINETTKEQRRVLDAIDAPRRYFLPPDEDPLAKYSDPRLSPEEYEDLERIERGREPRRPVWPRIIDWIFH